MPKNEFDFNFIKKRKIFIDKKRLFMARAKAGLTNKELCKKAGFSHRVTDNIAAGKSVHALTAGRLAEALNISVEYLLGEDGSGENK